MYDHSERESSSNIVTLNWNGFVIVRLYMAMMKMKLLSCLWKVLIDGGFAVGSLLACLLASLTGCNGMERDASVWCHILEFDVLNGIGCNCRGFYCIEDWLFLVQSYGKLLV